MIHWCLVMVLCFLIGVSQIWLKSKHDFHHATLGLFTGMFCSVFVSSRNSVKKLCERSIFPKLTSTSLGIDPILYGSILIYSTAHGDSEIAGGQVPPRLPVAHEHRYAERKLVTDNAFKQNGVGKFCVSLLLSLVAE